MLDIQHVVFAIYGAAYELLDEAGVDGNGISPMPNAPGTAAICRFPGNEPIVARLLVNVNGGKFAVEFELRARHAKRVIRVLEEAIAKADSLDKREV